MDVWELALWMAVAFASCVGALVGALLLMAGPSQRAFPTVASGDPLHEADRIRRLERLARDDAEAATGGGSFPAPRLDGTVWALRLVQFAAGSLLRGDERAALLADLCLDAVRRAVRDIGIAATTAAGADSQSDDAADTDNDVATDDGWGVGGDAAGGASHHHQQPPTAVGAAGNARIRSAAAAPPPPHVGAGERDDALRGRAASAARLRGGASVPTSVSGSRAPPTRREPPLGGLLANLRVIAVDPFAGIRRQDSKGGGNSPAAEDAMRVAEVSRSDADALWATVGSSVSAAAPQRPPHVDLAAATTATGGVTAPDDAAGGLIGGGAPAGPVWTPPQFDGDIKSQYVHVFAPPPPPMVGATPTIPQQTVPAGGEQRTSTPAAPAGGGARLPAAAMTISSRVSDGGSPPRLPAPAAAAAPTASSSSSSSIGLEIEFGLTWDCDVDVAVSTDLNVLGPLIARANRDNNAPQQPAAALANSSNRPTPVNPSFADATAAGPPGVPLFGPKAAPLHAAQERSGTPAGPTNTNPSLAVPRGLQPFRSPSPHRLSEMSTTGRKTGGHSPATRAESSSSFAPPSRVAPALTGRRIRAAPSELSGSGHGGRPPAPSADHVGARPPSTADGHRAHHQQPHTPVLSIPRNILSLRVNLVVRRVQMSVDVRLLLVGNTVQVSFSRPGVMCDVAAVFGSRRGTVDASRKVGQILNLALQRELLKHVAPKCWNIDVAAVASASAESGPKYATRVSRPARAFDVLAFGDAPLVRRDAAPAADINGPAGDISNTPSALNLRSQRSR